MPGRTWNVEREKAFKITAFSSNFLSAQQTMKYRMELLASADYKDQICFMSSSSELRLILTEQLRGEIHMLFFVIFCITAHTYRAA
jgi:hypothetical protein